MAVSDVTEGRAAPQQHRTDLPIIYHICGEARQETERRRANTPLSVLPRPGMQASRRLRRRAGPSDGSVPLARPQGRPPLSLRETFFTGSAGERAISSLGRSRVFGDDVAAALSSYWVTRRRLIFFLLSATTHHGGCAHPLTLTITFPLTSMRSLSHMITSCDISRSRHES